jgi:hypothetical protein
MNFVVNLKKFICILCIELSARFFPTSVSAAVLPVLATSLIRREKEDYHGILPS